MDGTTPKVSFIPKGSLVREQSFLERPRPRSVIGFLAIFAFVASIGSYAGLYFYNKSLDNDVAAKMDEIEETKKIFSDAPQVGAAQAFLSRTRLARELLDGHTVVSPALAFLSKNTLESISYEKFAFTRGTNGGTLELSGEAPTYAVLAYQGDVLRGKTEELSDFAISNVALTKFGTVTFTLSLSFVPGYLSYAKSLGSAENAYAQTAAEAMTPAGAESSRGGNSPSALFSTSTSSAPTTTPFPMGTSTAISPDFSGEAAGMVTEEDIIPNAVIPESEPATVVPPAEEKQSALRSFWSRFKFW